VDAIDVASVGPSPKASGVDSQSSIVAARIDPVFAGRAPAASRVRARKAATRPQRWVAASRVSPHSNSVNLPQGDGNAGFKDARRVQESLLAPLESRSLRWLARRMPASFSPDHLTLLGFVAQLLGGVSYALSGRWPVCLLAVNVFIALNWFGDSLDGTLARFRNKLRPRYGFYVDHMTDTFGALFLIFGLALSGYVTERVAIAMLVGFLMLSVNTYLATYTIGTFRLSFWKFSPTEMRILLAIGNTYAFYHPVVHFLGRERLFFDVAGIIASVSMAVVLVASTVHNTVLLYRAEPL
jgi:archaetidylinositol phosphate synthase